MDRRLLLKSGGVLAAAHFCAVSTSANQSKGITSSFALNLPKDANLRLIIGDAGVIYFGCQHRGAPGWSLGASTVTNPSRHLWARTLPVQDFCLGLFPDGHGNLALIYTKRGSDGRIVGSRISKTNGEELEPLEIPKSFRGVAYGVHGSNLLAVGPDFGLLSWNADTKQLVMSPTRLIPSKIIEIQPYGDQVAIIDSVSGGIALGDPSADRLSGSYLAIASKFVSEGRQWIADRTGGVARGPDSEAPVTPVVLASCAVPGPELFMILAPVLRTTGIRFVRVDALGAVKEEGTLSIPSTAVRRGLPKRLLYMSNNLVAVYADGNTDTYRV